MNNELLAALEMWIREVNTRRSVGIDMGDSTSCDFLKIWCYDYDLSEGNFVKTIEDMNNMDLKGKKKARITAEYLKQMEE